MLDWSRFGGAGSQENPGKGACMHVHAASETGVKSMEKQAASHSRRFYTTTIQRGKAAMTAGGGLVLLGATAALALSVLLPPGGTLPVPATTAATEPALDGVVIHDELVPFAIKAGGEVLCEGKLQDRVVRSNETGQYDFYYSIRETQGTGAIGRVATTSFGNLSLRVAYRADGLGTVPPGEAARNAAPGALLTFAFTDPVLSCERHEESRFILVRPETKTFRVGGETRISATTGASAVVATVMP